MKMLKPIPRFESELDERRFWETNDATDYFDLDRAFRVTTPNLRPHSAAVKSQEGVSWKIDIAFLLANRIKRGIKSGVCNSLLM
jgi:hypothetical protein